VAVRLVLFAAAREAAGRRVDEYDPGSVPSLDALLESARARYGPGFAEVLATARVWVNADEPAQGGLTPLTDGDEVAVLPPVSGGA
jgi:molybdopterin converting factor small subunit